MIFSIARPDVVRAIHQRWLLKFWKRHLGDQSVPQWQAIEAENLTAMSANLSFLDVTRNDGNLRFQIRFHGTVIAQAYGAGDRRGRYLDELIPPARYDDGLGPYQHAVQRGRPVYTIQDLKDRVGRLVHYERLLLPFAADGRTVDRILASYEFFCEDGAFDSRELMKMQTTTPTLRRAATIDSDAA